MILMGASSVAENGGALFPNLFLPLLSEGWRELEQPRPSFASFAGLPFI